MAWTRKEIEDGWNIILKKNGGNVERALPEFDAGWTNYFRNNNHPKELAIAEEVRAQHINPVKQDIASWEETLKKQEEEFQKSLQQ